MASQLVPMSKFLSQDATKQYLQSILGERTGHFITSLTSLAGSSAQLQMCDRTSLMGCALKATSLNLPFDPNLGQSWAVPYRNRDGSYSAQFQIGAKGWTQLAVRSGQYAGINSIEVKEGEFCGRDMLGDPVVNWLSEDERHGKKTVGYFAGFKTTNGYIKTIYWSVEEVERHAERFSQGYRYYKEHGESTSSAKSGNKSSPWVSDFDAMAKKTVLKSLISHYGPMSTEMQSAVKYDQAAINIDTETGEESVEYVDNEPETKAEGLSGEEQGKILEKYGAEKVTKALASMEYATLNEVPAESKESLYEVLEGLK